MFTITTIDQLKQLIKNCNELKGKNLIIEGITYNEEIINLLNQIQSKRIQLQQICFNKCKITDEYCPYHLDLYNELSIINCNLTPFQGSTLLEYLNPYSRISLDLSNNNLGSQDKQMFLNTIIKQMKEGTEGFSKLNLSNNGFTQSDISNFFNQIQFTGSSSKISFQ